MNLSSKWQINRIEEEHTLKHTHTVNSMLLDSRDSGKDEGRITSL